MAVQGSATTHTSRHNGHGPTIRHRPFATPIKGNPRGQAARGNNAPWFLTRRHLSKPRPQYATKQPSIVQAA